MLCDNMFLKEIKIKLLFLSTNPSYRVIISKAIKRLFTYNAIII